MRAKDRITYVISENLYIRFVKPDPIRDGSDTYTKQSRRIMLNKIAVLR